MFHDLDATLVSILNDSGTPLQLSAASVSFITPDKAFTITGATVNLFLYEVKENRELRLPEPIVERVGNGFVTKPSLLRVDCSYIVTTWSAQTGDAKVAEEHRLLAQALLWLTRFRTIPTDKLQGSLTNQPYPPPTMVAQMESNKNSAGEFWSALGIPPRPAFYLTVTITMDLGVQQTGPLVTKRSTSFDPGATGEAENWVQIGGRILTAGGQGIPDAWVDMVDAGLRARSDEEGRYSFVRVPLGAHTLKVVAGGYQPTSQAVKVEMAAASYDITLTPL